MSAAAGDERSRLLRALALSRRFHLLLAYVGSPRAADQLVRALAEELPRLRKAPVELVRLDPYEGRETDAPLEDGELADRVLIPLLSPTEEQRAHGVVHVVDASRATPADTEAWGRLFALWNEKRNALQQLGGEVLVVLPEPLQRLFATAAPDVWSIRSGEYAVREEAAQLEAMGMRGATATRRRDALGWYRALPPLALFGGDLLLSPWLASLAHGAGAESLAEPIDRRDRVSNDGAVVQRELRSAERALWEQRFAEATHALQWVLDAGPDDEARQRAVVALLVALAAQDRVDEALALHGAMSNSVRLPEWLHEQRLQAGAYVEWCAGHLETAAAIDSQRVKRTNPAQDSRSRMLRWVERGEISSARRWIAIVSTEGALDAPPGKASSGLIGADFYFLTSDLERAANLRGSPSPGSIQLRAALYTDTLIALVELARGNRPRALRLLNEQGFRLKRTPEPDVPARAVTFREFALGLLGAEGHDPTEALASFARAQAQVEAWSHTGLDRRSLHRASLAVDLAHATIDPAPTDRIGIARKLVERAVALLGDTAEDFIARVLAVESRRELAHRLADVDDDEATAEAHRALDLARPLAGRGVPSWDAILAATEREAFTRSLG